MKEVRIAQNCQKQILRSPPETRGVFYVYAHIFGYLKVNYTGRREDCSHWL